MSDAKSGNFNPDRGRAASFIGKAISHYRVLEQIGRGGMGEVFLAEDTILGRRVALKFLNDEENALERNRILAEARAAASLDHPSACKIFETCEWEGRHFIAMEFVEGQTLSHRLHSGALPLNTAVSMAIEIAEALAEAHGKGIIHCDLKPANVMVTRGEHVKLMDFGLARAVARPLGPDDETLTGSGEVRLGGTPSYMSPEQARGETLDARADVFAFGILFFEMLSGVHPFRKNTREATVGAILHESPAPIGQYLPTVPSTLGAILNRTLSRIASARYASAAELLADLIAFRDQGMRSIPAAHLPTIAILPFKDLSPQHDQEYFCDGLAEELIVELGRLERLRVVSRSAAFRYRAAEQSLAEIGRELGATAILEGSVRRAGDRLRIVVNLVEIENGCPVWSERYDRQFHDIFEIQDEISRSVADKLRVTLTPQPSRELIQNGTSNVLAFELYLKGRYFWNKRNEVNLRLAIDQFERAIEVDPRYALAFAGLADAWLTLSLCGANPPCDVIPLAKQAADRALALQPELPEALNARACIRAIFDWDWPASERDFEAVIRQNPRFAQARQWFAMNCLVPRGHFARAADELKQASELEPVSLAIATSMGVLDLFEQRYDSAISRLRGVLELDSGFGLAHYFLGQTYSALRRHEEAVEELETAVALSNRSAESLAALGYALATASRRAEALNILGELTDRAAESYVSPVLLAQVHTGLGQPDAAIANLEKAFKLRSTDLIWLHVRPAFGTLCSHPGAQRILEDIRLRTASETAVA